MLLLVSQVMNSVIIALISLIMVVFRSGHTFSSFLEWHNIGSSLWSLFLQFYFREGAGWRLVPPIFLSSGNLETSYYNHDRIACISVWQWSLQHRYIKAFFSRLYSKNKSCYKMAFSVTLSCSKRSYDLRGGVGGFIPFCGNYLNDLGQRKVLNI